MPTISMDRSHLFEKDARTRVQSYPIVYVFTNPTICGFHWILLDTRLRVTLCAHESRARVAREFQAGTRYLVGELYRILQKNCFLTIPKLAFFELFPGSPFFELNLPVYRYSRNSGATYKKYR